MTIELIADNDVLEVLIPGEAGPPGAGIALGGSTGQKLVKLSNADGDAGWANDFVLASQAEAEAGADNTKISTPLRVAQAISARINDTLTSSSTTLALSAAQGKVLQDSKAPLASPAFSGTPTAPTPAPGNTSTLLATTQFVADAVAAGLAGQTPRASVKAVAVSNVSLSGLQTIDGYTLLAGESVLVAGNTAGAENGPYVAAAGAWSRRTDFDTSGEATTGAAFLVTNGTLYGGTTWTLITGGVIVLGTTPLVFSQTGASGGNAGNGLQKSGSTLSLATLAPGQVFLGNGSSVATATSISGVLQINSSGVTSFAAGAIVNADINAAAAIADTKLATISTAGKVANSATTATSANTVSAIVARDGSGNFSAGTITANLTGTASLATASTTQALSDASTAIATTLFVKTLFGAGAAGGTADWNSAANTRAGSGPNLLAGNASNGPSGTASLFHPLNLESGTARDGTGDLAQLAIGQNVVDLYLRGRNSGAWSSWQRLLHDGNISSYAASVSAANTFLNAGGQTIRAAAGQDGLLLQGRAGGSAGYAVTLIPTTLSASRTLTLPNVSGTVITTGDTGTVTSAMLVGSIADSKLSTITTAGKVSGSAITSGDISTSGSFSTSGAISTTSTLAVGQASAAANVDLDLAGTYAQTIVSMGANAIDCSTGNYFTKTISGNTTFTVSNVPASRSYAFTLELNHTAGTVTWFSGVVWPDGVTPALTTGKTHLFMFVTDNGGTRWRGAALTNYTT